MTPAAARGARVERDRDGEPRRASGAPDESGAPWTHGAIRWGGIVALVGAVVTVLGVMADPGRAAAAYLVAYASAVAVVLGALGMLMIAYATRATWFVVLRRSCEDVAATLPVLAALAIPLLVAIPVLYPWAGAGAPLTPEQAARVTARQPWLAAPFFVARTVIYLAIWIALAEMLRRWSLRQDMATPEEARALRRRMVAVSAIGLPIYAFTTTFASFDWLMSLTVEWYSTVFGAYYWAGGFAAALGLLALLLVPLGDVSVVGPSHAGPGVEREVATPEQASALGRLTLTSVILWAYLAFSQLIVVWSGNLPSEISFYVPRMSGGWGVVGLAVAVGQFAIPCLLLLSRDVRRHPRVLALLGAWLLAFHWLDVEWLVIPSIAAPGLPFIWLDLAATATVWGACLAMLGWRRRGHAPLPVGDPELERSVAYRG